MTVCPSCGYERTEVDSVAPEGECPKCGVVYGKANSGESDVATCWVRVGGEVYEADLQKLQRWAEEGRITGDTKVRQRTKGWREARTVPEIRRMLAPPAPQRTPTPQSGKPFSAGVPSTSTNVCPRCGSDQISKNKDIGCVVVILIFVSLGIGLIMIPFLPTKCKCRACSLEWKV